MKKLEDLKQAVTKINNQIKERSVDHKEGTAEYKVLDFSLQTGMTMMVALNETLALIDSKAPSYAEKILVLDLVSAVETWCSEIKSALKGEDDE
jgi:hypothetical protein